MREAEHIILGSFQMTSSTARISDPCYTIDTKCAGTIGLVMRGEWIAQVIKSYEGEWGNRCAYLIAHHVNTPTPTECDMRWRMQNIDVGVDSGQAGIFDNIYYKDDNIVNGIERISDEIICEDDPWYSICCDRTLGEVGAGTIPYGCVSSSGFGDGRYTCSIIKDGMKVIAIMIDFGLNDEKDNEELD